MSQSTRAWTTTDTEGWALSARTQAELLRELAAILDEGMEVLALSLSPEGIDDKARPTSWTASVLLARIPEQED